MENTDFHNELMEVYETGKNSSKSDESEEVAIASFGIATHTFP